MMKHWQKIVLVLGIIFLSIAGYFVYIFQFKEYEIADEKVDKVVEEAYEVALPDGSVIIVDKDGEIVEGATAAGGAVPEGTTTSDGGTPADAAAGSADSAASPSSEGTASGSATPASGTASSAPSASSSATAESKTDKAADKTSSPTDGSGTTAGSGSAASDTSGNGSTNGESAGSDQSGVKAASIKQKYEPTLADIEDQVSTRIGGLISAAQSEYAQKKANSESISFPYFYNKYVTAATELENRTDTVFYAVIGSLEKDLKANGLAESHAESFVSEYEARKEARKSELIRKASGM